MEFIKKKVHQKLTIVTTGCTCPDCPNPTFCKAGNGCTGTCYVIIPDKTANYCFKILLKQDSEDIGFFDALIQNDTYNMVVVNDKYYAYLNGLIPFSQLDIVATTGVTGNTVISSSYSVPITGSCKTRLNELRKYTITTVFSNQYIVGGSPTNDGVSLNNSPISKMDYGKIINGKVTYYLGGIRYVDTIVTGTTINTTFSFIGQGYNSLNFIDVPYYKNSNKENIISNPKIYDDVFIIRQEVSAFDKNYRLEYLNNLNDVETYAAGGYFNIVKNT